MNKIYLINISTLFIINTIHSQQIIRGHIYNAVTNAPVIGAKVESSSGKTATSNMSGAYSIAVFVTDTLWFWVQRRKSYAYPVKEILHPEAFDISMQVGTNKMPYNFTRDIEGRLPEIIVPSSTKKSDSLPTLPPKNSTTTLAPVTVYQRNYHNDSLRDRDEYAKYFNYKKPKVGDAISIGGAHLNQIPTLHEVPVIPIITIDITKLYDALNKKEIKSSQRLQRRLISNEQEGYVDSRFKKTTIVKYLGAQPDSTLNDFMKKYRPPYLQIVALTELDLARYIKNAFKEYKNKEQADSLKMK